MLKYTNNSKCHINTMQCAQAKWYHENGTYIIDPHEASLTIQTFMIDKWDIHTKEKGHSLSFL
jgi:hypothetical protein